MKCYKHIEKEAVAQCSRCGKFLCSECTTKYKGIICDECVETIQQKQEQDEQRFAKLEQMNKDEDEGKWFTRATIFMVVVFLVVAILTMLLNGGLLGIIRGLVLGLVCGCLSAGYAYGWKVFDDSGFFESLSDAPFIGRALHVLVKYVFGGIVGFVLYLRKLFGIRKGKSTNDEVNE